MANISLRRLVFDEKIRSIWIQAFVIGLFAFLIYTVSQTTAYNLEKRGIGTGFGFLQMSAGYDISFSLIEFTSKDSHLKAYYVGVLNTLLVSISGIFGEASPETLIILTALFWALVAEEKIVSNLYKLYLNLFHVKHHWACLAHPSGFGPSQGE